MVYSLNILALSLSLSSNWSLFNSYDVTFANHWSKSYSSSGVAAAEGLLLPFLGLALEPRRGFYLLVWSEFLAVEALLPGLCWFGACDAFLRLLAEFLVSFPLSYYACSASSFFLAASASRISFSSSFFMPSSLTVLISPKLKFLSIFSLSSSSIERSLCLSSHSAAFLLSSSEFTDDVVTIDYEPWSSRVQVWSSPPPSSICTVLVVHGRSSSDGWKTSVFLFALGLCLTGLYLPSKFLLWYNSILSFTIDWFFGKRVFSLIFRSVWSNLEGENGTTPLGGVALI